MFKLELKKTGNVQKDAEAFNRAVKRAIWDLADEIMRECDRTVPVDEGNLKRSGNVRYGDGYAVVGYNSPYGKYVHDGTAPHDIVPRNAKALHFQGEGGDVFAKRVHHPGTRPQPWLQNAIDRVTARARQNNQFAQNVQVHMRRG